MGVLTEQLFNCDRSLNASYARDGSPSHQQGRRRHAEDTPPGGSSGQLAGSSDHVARDSSLPGVRKNVHNVSFPGYSSADSGPAGFSRGRMPTEDVSRALCPVYVHQCSPATVRVLFNSVLDARTVSEKSKQN